MPEANTAQGRVCRGCTYWSQWLPNTGDCMAYAYKRRQAFEQTEDTAAWREAWPLQAAKDTGGDDTCDDWEAK